MITTGALPWARSQRRSGRSVQTSDASPRAEWCGGATIEHLGTVALMLRAAMAEEDFERAVVVGHRFQSLLLDVVRTRTLMAERAGEPVPCSELCLALELVRRTRRTVLAAVVRDPSKPDDAAMVASLTALYARQVRRRAAITTPMGPR